MAFATATSAQAVATRNAAVKATKLIELAVESGPMAIYGPQVDTASMALVTALQATGSAIPATSAIVPNGGAYTIPVTGTYATKITLTVAGGAITGAVLS